MLCWVVSGVGRGMSVLDGWRTSKGSGMDSFVGKYGDPIVISRDFVAILCRKGWRRGSSQITLGFLVYIHFVA